LQIPVKERIRGTNSPDPSDMTESSELDCGVFLNFVHCGEPVLGAEGHVALKTGSSERLERLTDIYRSIEYFCQTKAV
jgi:hypothetical protein